MTLKSIICITCTCFAFAPFNVFASLVNADLTTAGDNLVSYDDATGLEWLDLTETNGLSYDYVSGQFGNAGQFAGFRYATNSEVVGLWAHFGVNLNTGAEANYTGPADQRILAAADMLGNVYSEYNNLYSGLVGITSYIHQDLTHGAMGAFLFPSGSDITNIYWGEQELGYTGNNNAIQTASYLVRVSAVPIPASVWLFASGFVALVRIARRNKI